MGPNTYANTLMACEILGAILVYISALELNKWFHDGT
jgi:hypothetical protein